MAKKSTTSKLLKQGKKMAKKNPKGFLVVIVIIVVLAAIAAAGFFAFRNSRPNVSFTLIGPKEASVALNTTYKERGTKAMYNGKDVTEKVVTTYYLGDAIVNDITTEEEATFTVKYNLDFQKYSGELERKVKVTALEAIDINFLELGNKYTGDSTFIKAGSTDILIDAGSRQSSASTIASFVDTFCEDGVLEYVIATHAHQDHIEGFTSTNTNPGIFDRLHQDTPQDSTVFRSVEQMPRFPGGEAALMKYIQSHVNYPEGTAMGDKVAELLKEL